MKTIIPARQSTSRDEALRSPVGRRAFSSTPLPYRRWLTAMGIGATLGAWAADPPVSNLKEPLAPGSEFEQLASIKVTSVSRSDSTVQQSPAAVFVITSDMIRRSGATAIPELLRMVPGMNVARIDGNKWAVSARGLNTRFEDKLLVQIDGRTVYNPVFSGVYWDTQDYPMEDIERIEVIRGPGASVWGANAVNGIISVVTKPAADTQGGLVSVAGGTVDQGMGTVRFGGKLRDDLSYRVYGKGFTRDQSFATVGDPHDGWWSGSGGMRLDWKANELDNLTLDGGFLHSDSGRRDSRAQVAAPFFFVNFENEVTDSGHILGRWNHVVDPDHGWQLQMYWDRNFRLLDNLPASLRWDIWELDYQRQLVLGDRNKLVFGLNYRFVDANLVSSQRDAGFALDLQPAHRQAQLVSAFLQDEITIVQDRLRLILGTKIERNEYTGFEFQPSARLLFTPTPSQSMWAAASRATRTPNLSEDAIGLGLLPLAGPVFPRIMGNAAFKSEELWAYELGYRVQPHRNVSFDTSVFYHLYHDLRVTVPGAVIPRPPAILPLQYQNGMDGEYYGAELAAMWQVAEAWQLHAAYTLLKANLHRRPGLAASAEAAETQTPQNQFHLRSSWTLPRNVEVDLTGRYVDRLSGFGGAADVIPSYVALDARIGWSPRKNLTLELIG